MTLSLSLSSQCYKCLPQAENFCLFFALKGHPQPFSHFTIMYFLIAYCWQKMSGLYCFERAPSASLIFHNNISACSRQKFLDLLGFERAPLSVHNNVSACQRQKNFGFERAPTLSLQQCKCLPQAENFWLWKGPLSLSFTYLDHNITSACCRQNFLTFLALKGPFSL